MKLLYVTSEAYPFCKTGGLADVAGSLPAAINKKGHDCRVVIPLYKCVKPQFRVNMTFLTHITVDVSWRKQYCGIFTSICIFEVISKSLFSSKSRRLLQRLVRSSKS